VAKAAKKKIAKQKAAKEALKTVAIIVEELAAYLKHAPNSGPPEGSPRHIGMLTISMEAQPFIDRMRTVLAPANHVTTKKGA